MSELNDVADTVYGEHGFSDEGINCLVRQLRGRALRKQVFAWAARNLLREAMRGVRATAGVTENGQPKTFDADQQEAIVNACRGFLDRPLMSGKRLGDATRADLLADAQRYEQYAEGNAREARFLFAVADKVKDGQSVRDVLDEDKLRKLHERAQKRK